MHCQSEILDDFRKAFCKKNMGWHLSESDHNWLVLGTTMTILGYIDNTRLHAASI